MTTNCGSWRPDFARDDGGGGNAEQKREGDAGEEGEEQGLRGGMEAPGEGGPEEHGGDRAPGAGAGLAVACAEEGGDGPGPGVFVRCGVLAGELTRADGVSLHRVAVL